MRRIERLIANNLKKILFVVGLSIFAIYLYTFDFRLLEDIVLEDIVLRMLIITFLVMVFFISRAVRWYVLLNSIGVKVPFKKLYIINSVALGVGIYTPAYLGEAIKLQLLKTSEGIKRRVTLQLFMLEKIFDLFTVLLFALFGGFVLNYISLRFVSFLLVFCFLFFVFFKSIILKKISVMRQINYKVLFTIFIISVISWLTIIYTWVILADIIQVSANMVEMMLVNSLSTLVILLSFVPGGLGFLEISNSYFISKVFSVDLTTGLLFALLVRLYTIYVLLIGLFHLLFTRRN